MRKSRLFYGALCEMLYRMAIGMKHFDTYRKFIFVIGILIVLLGTVACLFLFSDIKVALTFLAVLWILFGLIFLIDYLHNQYTDDLLEDLALLIENLVGQQEMMLFPETEDTLISRLQHQLLKLRSILLTQNKLLEDEKDKIKMLISDISHQIKTPLASANAFAELLDDALSEEERNEYIQLLRESLNKLTFLTDSLIKISRLESGIINLKTEKIILNDIILQAVKSVYLKAKEKDIAITFDNECAYAISLDFNWTAEAVTNVLDNAVKYTQNGGVIIIRITDYPSYLRLDITDNGSGISEEEQAKIFSRFYRGEHSSGVEGVGIGLYLTREIINLQNGYIKVSSNANGSTFSLFFRKTN